MAKYLFLILLVLAATWANSGDAAEQQPAVAKRPQATQNKKPSKTKDDIMTVWADVEVMLINGDEENPANVYGQLTASPNSLPERTLFDRGSHDAVDVHPGNNIPLFTSEVAVPVHTNLKIRASLYDYDTFSSDDEIAMGWVTFPAQSPGATSQNQIKGKYGVIQVTVTWR